MMIVVVLALLFTMASMSAILLMMSQGRHQAATAALAHERAYQACESGLDFAITELRLGTDFGGDGLGVVSGTLGGATLSIAIAPKFAGAGTYTITSQAQYNQTSRSIEAVIVASDGGEFLSVNGKQVEPVKPKGILIRRAKPLSRHRNLARDLAMLDAEHGGWPISGHGALRNMDRLDVTEIEIEVGKAGPNNPPGLSKIEVVMLRSRI
ncbi:MAG: hypothetical protein V3W41_08335 [Planctomycetota bacterium]